MSQRATRAKKLGVTLLVSSVAASLSPLLASPAGAAPPAAPSIAAVCVNTDNVNDFTDLGASSGEALDAINCLVDLGLVNGTGDGTTFSPTQSLTRQQGAALIVRIADAKNANDADGGVTLTDVPATGPDQFTDDEGSTLEDSINRLAGVNIIVGKTDTIFDPTAPLTRGQFASLIDRMETYLVTGSVTGTSPWATTTDYFTDDNGSVHEAAINRVAEQGILRGDGDVTSGVNDPISRTQAALVIARVLAVNLADGLITVPERTPVSNQTFTATPAAAATNTVSADAPNQNRGARQYSVAIPSGTTTVDIALVPCENVTVSEAGVVSFADTDDPAANQADDLGDTDAVIEVVNGVAGDFGDYVNDVSVVGGNVTFTVDSEDAECVIPVVFADANNNNALAVNATNQPTEAFAIGGAKTFIPAESASGAFDVDVVQVDKEQNFFVGVNGDTRTFIYDGNDIYQMWNGSTCIQVTQAVFEANLSTDDIVFGTYNADEQFPSTFCLEDLSPESPGISLNVIDNDSIRVTITDVDADTYRVYRALEPDPGDCPETLAGYALVATIPGTQLTFVDDGLSADTEYCYTVTAVVDGDESEIGDIDAATTGTGPETDRPISTDAELTTSGGFANRLDPGDVLKGCFDEALAAPANGDAVEFVDGDGDITTLTAGGNATFALGVATDTQVGDADDGLPESCPAAQTLIITVTGTVADQNPGVGDDDFVNPPVAATDSAGVTDLAGNEWDLGDSDDILFDLNAADDDEFF